MEFSGRGHPRFYEILQELAELHDRKNSDYATASNPLANFERVGKAGKEYNLITNGNESVKVALLYAWKQIDAVNKMVGNSEAGKAESVLDKFNDIAVYMILARIMYEESERG